MDYKQRNFESSKKSKMFIFNCSKKKKIYLLVYFVKTEKKNASLLVSYSSLKLLIFVML
jgi:hypothetical protein